MKLFKHQIEAIKRGTSLIKSHNGFLLFGDLRTGKTLVSLHICQSIGAISILFLTKKAAIQDIRKDFISLSQENSIRNTMYLNIQTKEYFQRNIQSFIKQHFDVIIIDESHHKIAAFPKPSSTHKALFHYINKYNPKVMLLTGTPNAESQSQLYHQIFLIPDNALRKRYSNFYKFAEDNVRIKELRIGQITTKEYKQTKLTRETEAIFKNYIIRMRSDEEPLNAFEERIIKLSCEASDKYMNEIRTQFVCEELEIANINSNPKLLHTLRMIASGTYFKESRDIQGNHNVAYQLGFEEILYQTQSAVRKYGFFHENCKLKWLTAFCKDCNKDKRIAIFFYYKSELAALRQIFTHYATENVELFNAEEYNLILLQSTSKREGIRLAKLDYMIFLTMDYSTVTYLQARQRGLSYVDKTARDYKILYLLNSSDDAIDIEVHDKVVVKGENFHANDLKLYKKKHAYI